MADPSLTSPEPEQPAVQGDARRIEAFCRRLVELMRLDLEVTAREEDSTLHVNLSGPDRPVLLSGGAAVLNCLEYLVNKSFRTGKGEKIATILMDSDQYRHHREAELILLARMASQKVMSQRRPLSLQPMTPRERRIVHLALAAIEGVRSESEGQGENRSVTIFPA